MELDQLGVETNFVAKNLIGLPSCDPKDIDPFATLQRLIALESRVMALETSTGGLKAESTSYGDTLNKVSSTVSAHEAWIQGRESGPDSCKQTYASVACTSNVGAAKQSAGNNSASTEGRDVNRSAVSVQQRKSESPHQQRQASLNVEVTTPQEAKGAIVESEGNWTEVKKHKTRDEKVSAERELITSIQCEQFRERHRVRL